MTCGWDRLPWAPYTEERVHPQNSINDRPGWLRISDYGAGMITGWGSHHLDIAHWGMGTEYTGPVEVEGQAEFPKDGLWDVHGTFHIEYTYANGVKMICEDEKKVKNGIRFEGDKGWIFVTRGAHRRRAEVAAAGDDRRRRDEALREQLPQGQLL